jgi:CBS domain-containing protein
MRFVSKPVAVPGEGCSLEAPETRWPQTHRRLERRSGRCKDLARAGYTEVKTMKVRDIMTRKVVSCHKETDIGTAARLMLQGRFGTLPVVDAHGRLAGIVTDRDIAMAAATRQRNASHIAVHEAMTERVRSCFAEDDLGGALKQMEEARVRRLPVLDATWHLTGILSVDDIVVRALDEPHGVSSAELANALRRICSQPSLEPEVNVSDTFVSG